MSAGQQSKDINQMLSENEHKVLSHRTRLHTRDIVYWLRKRFLNKNPNMNYLFFPEELQKHYEVDKIFKKFDEDGSGKLSIDEFYDMLVASGINMDVQDLREFYERADEDHDLAFDFKEFKNCTLSEEANYHFANMMNKVRRAYEEEEKNRILEEDEDDQSPKEISKAEEGGEDDHEHKKKIKRKPYLPRTFGNLLNYITYTNRKRELTDILNDDSMRRSDRFGTFKELIDLKMGRDVYLAKFYERFKVDNPESKSNTHRSKADLNELSSVLDTRRRATLSNVTNPPVATSIAMKTEEDDLQKEIEALADKGRKSGLEQFEKRKLRIMKLKGAGPESYRSSGSQTATTSRTKRVHLKKIEHKSSSFKGLHGFHGLHSKNLSSTIEVQPADGFKIVKIPNLNLKNPSLIPENAGRLSSMSSRGNNNNTIAYPHKEKRASSLAHNQYEPASTNEKTSLLKVKSLQDNHSHRIITKPQSPPSIFGNYMKELNAKTQTDPDSPLLEEKKFVKNCLRFAENKSPLGKAELHLEHEGVSLHSESSAEVTGSFQDLVKRRKMQVSFGIPATKVSKMPSFYNNYSSTFDNYVTTPDTLASTRLATTPTDGFYPSARTIKVTSSPIKTPSSAGTFFKSSLPPSRSINYQVGRKNSENSKNILTSAGSMISVTGNKANKSMKSKSARLIMTGFPEVKRDKKF